jgi:hypothetical protein
VTIAFRTQELSFRTQYAEVKERVLNAGKLLPGTTGTLYLRRGTGHGYWYRVFYSVPGKQAEELVCKEGDNAAIENMRERMAFSEWVSEQVSKLRLLGFQTADKKTARVLVELHNRGLFQQDAGLVLVGTLAYTAWLNELGAIATAARTEDVDLARAVRLGVQQSFLETMVATGMPFVAVPGMPAGTPPTSVKLPGAQGLRVDLLVHGKQLGQVEEVPELSWAAQTVTHMDYLTSDPSPGALLAGSHCIPVRLPKPAHFVWHKLLVSTERKGFPEKAQKDLRQAFTLAGALAETDDAALRAAFRDAPKAMKDVLRKKARPWLQQLKGNGLLYDSFSACLK